MHMHGRMHAVWCMPSLMYVYMYVVLYLYDRRRWIDMMCVCVAGQTLPYVMMMCV
jgi:hypothetical protein